MSTDYLMTRLITQ